MREREIGSVLDTRSKKRLTRVVRFENVKFEMQQAFDEYQFESS